MEQVTVWYLTDNDHGKKLAGAIGKLGLETNLIESDNLYDTNIKDDEINIFIFDLMKSKPEDLIKKIKEELKIQSFIKYLILTKKQINEVSNLSYNILHLEFISRPVNKREFLLLLEKTIIVERYREIMKYVSKESESRIQTYEGLLDINRKNVFESESDKQAFEKILIYEKGLLKEQFRLNKAIKEFSMMRQLNLYDMQKRILAEESLSELRQMELRTAKEVINAQESVIDFSVMQLEEAKEILDASQSVAELSRTEAMKLHDDLRRERELNKRLSEEVERLLKEVEILHKK